MFFQFINQKRAGMNSCESKCLLEHGVSNIDTKGGYGDEIG